MEFPDCLICSEPIYYSVLLPCGHMPMCVKCLQTLSLCYNQHSCPICQKEIDKDPIITEKHEELVYDEEIKENYKHSDKFHVFYKDDEVLEIMGNNLKYQCPDCGEFFSNWKECTSHISKHGLAMCKVCSRSKMFLNIDVPIFSKRDLPLHLKQHPKCIVCPYQAFDAHDLSVHMSDTHVRCPICAKHDRILWFATKEAFFEHNKERHYVCEAPECLEKGTVAFDSSLELQLHQAQVHKKRIPCTFTPKEYKEDYDEEGKERKEARKRHQDACIKLGLKANEEFHGNRKRVGNLLQSIDLLDEGKVTAKQFLKQYHRICGKLSEVLFCDTVSAIGDAEARALVVRIQEGYRLGKEKIDDDDTIEKFPALNDAYGEDDKRGEQESKGRGRGRGKGRGRSNQ